MIADAINLDAYRGPAARRAAEIRRRRLKRSHESPEDIQCGREELGQLLGLSPAQSWSKVAPKVQYVVRVFATTPEAREPGRMALIGQILDDLAWLNEKAEKPS